MNIQKTTQNVLEDIKIHVKLKIASLWTSFMFLYIYVDYFHLYMPGCIKEILAGKVFVFEISQSFLLTAFVSILIPVLMIFLSVALPAKINRLANLIVAFVYIPYTIFNLVGVAWVHMYIAAFIEVLLLGLIIYFALKWPRKVN